jgi:hypothetical protein
VVNSEQRLLSVLATLDQSRDVLLAGGEPETALLVSVAILELRMKLNRITDFELKALCDAMLPVEVPVQRSRQRRPPLLRLVK